MEGGINSLFTDLGPLDTLNLPHTDDALFWVPNQVKEWAEVINALTFQLYKSPDIPIGLDPEEMTLYQLLVKLSPEPDKAAAKPRETTFNFQGQGALADLQLIVHTNNPDKSLTQLMSFFNFYYNSGCYSDYDNQSERFAAVVSLYLHSVNTAVITLLRQTFQKLMNPEERERAEETKLQQGGNPISSPTFSLETFRESLNTTIGEINRVQAELAKDPENQEAIMNLFHLMGIQPEEEDMEALDIYYHLRIMDIAFITFMLDKLTDFKFIVKTPNGGNLDLEDLENLILTTCFEIAFDETLDDHMYNRSALQQGYEQQMFHFYELFWETYLSNALPIIIMDFFNFTHGLTLIQQLQGLDFMQALILATIDEDWNPENNPQVNLELGWFLEENLEEELNVEQISRLPGKGANSTQPNPFRWANPNFNKAIMRGMQEARVLLEAYTKDIQNRVTVLTSSFYHMFESERRLYQIFDESLSNEDQAGFYEAVLQLILSDRFLVNPEVVTFYLEASLSNQKEILSRLVQMDLSSLPINYMAILNLYLTWFPQTGIPSFRYYIFNSYLKPVNLLGGDHAWYGLLEGEDTGQTMDVTQTEEWIETEDDMAQAHAQQRNNDFTTAPGSLDLTQLADTFNDPTLLPPGMGKLNFQ